MTFYWNGLGLWEDNLWQLYVCNLCCHLKDCGFSSEVQMVSKSTTNIFVTGFLLLIFSLHLHHSSRWSTVIILLLSLSVSPSQYHMVEMLDIMISFRFSLQHSFIVFSRHEFSSSYRCLQTLHTHKYTLLSEDFYYLCKSKVFWGGMQC